MSDLRVSVSLAAVVVFLIPIAVRAQDARGAILGRVTDPSGAVVAGADVRATNVSTGVAAAARSNEAGNFRMPYLLPGTYTVQVETAGFKKFVREGIQVRVSDAVEVNVSLELGSAAESVEVRADTPLLSTAEASLGQVVDERRIAELPQFGSSPMDLVHLAPGTINTANMRVRKPNPTRPAPLRLSPPMEPACTTTSSPWTVSRTRCRTGRTLTWRSFPRPPPSASSRYRHLRSTLVSATPWALC
ncbi:MAG: carboxypeptidase regulatory-like domain-containing protein [Acidobacteria bacterium]|nr:carboxypeptidase regulatory-like domain-containing protein [Acidobacteriota bacterium]